MYLLPDSGVLLILIHLLWDQCKSSGGGGPSRWGPLPVAPNVSPPLRSLIPLISPNPHLPRGLMRPPRTRRQSQTPPSRAWAHVHAHAHAHAHRLAGGGGGCGAWVYMRLRALVDSAWVYMRLRALGHVHEFIWAHVHWLIVREFTWAHVHWLTCMSLHEITWQSSHAHDQGRPIPHMHQLTCTHTHTHTCPRHREEITCTLWGFRPQSFILFPFYQGST